MTAVAPVVLAALLGGALALEAAARLGHGWATAGQTVAAAMRTTPGRIAVLLAWFWVGVHVLAR